VSGSAPPPGPWAASRPAWFRRSWPYLRVLIGLTAIGVAAWAISGKTDELRSVGDYLSRLRWWWMAVALVAEGTCYGALSSLQRRLLRAGGVVVPPVPMFGITLAGSAIQNSFPGGSVIYLAYLFRQFRRRGADDLLSTWALVAFNLVTFATLAALAAVGLALAFGTGNSFDLVETILGVLMVAVLFALTVTQRRRLAPYATHLVRLCQQLFHRPQVGTPAEELVRRWTEELGAISPSRRVWVRASTMGMINWLADMSCLAVSFYAVGVGVPWRGLLLAYGAGQLASALPITPGGLGAVEGSITVALVTFGGGESSTVAAVLLYRMVSFWLILPVGWTSWAAIALANRSAQQMADVRSTESTESTGPAAAAAAATEPAEPAGPVGSQTPRAGA
jgi:putative heme transporter